MNNKELLNRINGEIDPEVIAILEARLEAAEELVEHILTSESRNPELGLALAFRAAGKGDK